MKFGMNIGAGPVHLDSNDQITWENSDFADTESGNAWTLDKKRDFTKPMEDIGNNSVDYILAWHIIEHVGLHERDNLIKEWYRVLSPEGLLFIACPDLTKIAQHIVNREGSWQDWFICMVNVFGPYNGYVGDYHKWGYDTAELTRVLKEDGFFSVRELDPDTLKLVIGDNAGKVGFAPYNVQLVATK